MRDLTKNNAYSYYFFLFYFTYYIFYLFINFYYELTDLSAFIPSNGSDNLQETNASLEKSRIIDWINKNEKRSCIGQYERVFK